MAEITSASVVKDVNEGVRPMCERAFGLLTAAKASKPAFAAVIAELSGAADADVINDGRLATEGVRPVTVKQVRDCVGLLDDLVNTIEADPRLASVLGSMARKYSLIS